MKSVITNAAEITILEVIDNTFKTGGGPASVGGTVIQASKGPVGVVTKVTASDWEDIFGKPLTKKSDGMEGLRHLSEAAKECNYVNVVRCVASDAKFPVLTFAAAVYEGEWAVDTAYSIGDFVVRTDGTTLLRCVVAHTSGSAGGDEPAADGSDAEWELVTDSAFKGEWAVSTTYALNDIVARTDGTTLLRCVVAHTTAADATEPAADGSDAEWVLYNAFFGIPSNEAYGTDVVLGTTDMMHITPVDGDPSVNRVLKFQNIDTDTERFDIVIEDKNALGESVEIERLTVAVDVDAKDDMGAPAYIETVFETQSSYFLVEWNEDYAWSDILYDLQAIEDSTGSARSFAFAGGTNGGTPTTDDWKDAWGLLSNENILVNMLFAAGNYDADVVSHMADIAHSRHCASFADAPPYLPHDQAITWVTDAGIKNRHLRLYHCPFKASDPWRGGKTVWGASGAAVAAKAKGNAIFTGATPGVHYAPAGPKRGVLNRTGMQPLFPDDIIDRDALYTARINPVVALQSGGAVIDDDLTAHYLQNYSRFGWVNDILDYVDHRFLEGASYAKFEPDGLTREILTDLTKKILDDLVASGGLVPPREPEVDGTEPYVLTITQVEIDLWKVQWDICPTGSARRIAGQPRLIR